MGKPLTRREQQVLAGMADGRTNKEIAAALFVSAETVKFHARGLFAKLEVNSRTEAVAARLRKGLLDLASPDVEFDPREPAAENALAALLLDKLADDLQARAAVLARTAVSAARAAERERAAERLRRPPAARRTAVPASTVDAQKTVVSDKTTMPSGATEGEPTPPLPTRGGNDA